MTFNPFGAIDDLETFTDCECDKVGYAVRTRLQSLIANFNFSHEAEWAQIEGLLPGDQIAYIIQVQIAESAHAAAQ